MAYEQHTKIGVLGLPINKKGQFLLTQRHDPKNPIIEGKWQIAGGGMEFGEQPLQTLAREMEEELQVSFKTIWEYPIAFSTTWSAEETKRDYHSHVFLVTYLIDIGNQTPECEQDPETKTWGWYSFEEAIALDCMRNTRETITQAQEIIEKYNLMNRVGE